MNISWQNLDGSKHTALVPVNIWPIVEALGMDDAAEFLLHFRGRHLYINKGKGQARGSVTKLLGSEKATQLAKTLTAAGYGQQNGKKYRVPTAYNFLCRYLRSNGFNLTQIAARLGTTDVTVRNYLRSDQELQRLRDKQHRKNLSTWIDEAVALGLVVRVEPPTTMSLISYPGHTGHLARPTHSISSHQRKD